MKYIIYIFSLLLLTFSCQEEQPDNKTENSMAQNDPLAPSAVAEGLCGGLHTATIATTNLEKYKQFYVDAMGMTLDGPLDIKETVIQQQRKLWGIPAEISWQTYRLHRPNVPGLIQIRLLLLEQETPSIHKSYSSRELGPFSLGFPNGDQMQLDKELRDKGFNSMAPVQVGTIERPDGSSYRYIETIYQAPDFLHAVGIERKDGVPQLAPIDTLTKKGGPGYSAMVLDDSDAFLSFLTDVLDLELRADRHWETSEGSALGLEPGIPFRFSLVYAKGAGHNHLLFLDYEDGKFESIEVAPRIPNRGLGMWTFETTNIAEIEKRAQAKGIEVVPSPLDYTDVILGKAQVMTLLAPNGFLIEVFQR
ncbi:MAG: extradiol dioxygenase [Saprospiraceae bacterium]|nr:extradiol dioxygenase [Saprospiraceae bacterium]